MKLKTWKRWLHRYGEAYLQAAMAGSRPTGDEAVVARDAARRELVKAEAALFRVAILETSSFSSVSSSPSPTQ